MANDRIESPVPAREVPVRTGIVLSPAILVLLVLAALPGFLLCAVGIVDLASDGLRLRVKALIRERTIRSYRDIEVARNLRAAMAAAAVVDDYMPTAKSFANREKLIQFALSEIGPALKDSGLYCEFGVFQGESINFIASQSKNTIHGFDSFEGLPDDWRGAFPAGTFKMKGLPPVRANVKLYKGWFNETIPGWMAANPGPLAFVHMDADLYSSTKTVFDMLGDRFVAGTVIEFDELINYPGWEQGEWKALSEFRKQRNAEVKFLGYVGTNEQVAIKILKIDPVAVRSK